MYEKAVRPGGVMGRQTLMMDHHPVAPEFMPS
jgi:hypothetical protein